MMWGGRGARPGTPGAAPREGGRQADSVGVVGCKRARSSPLLCKAERGSPAFPPKNKQSPTKMVLSRLPTPPLDPSKGRLEQGGGGGSRQSGEAPAQHGTYFHQTSKRAGPSDAGWRQATRPPHTTVEAPMLVTPGRPFPDTDTVATFPFMGNDSPSTAGSTSRRHTHSLCQRTTQRC